MPLIRKNNEDKLYFIHIPRTAGRFINRILLNNNLQLTNDHFEKIDKDTGKEIPHLHYPYYKKYNLNNVPYFAVVRDPVNRFVSAISQYSESRFFLLNANDVFMNQNSFNNYVNNLNNTLKSNWFLPQHNFITDEVNVWKFENGFKDNFKKWFKEKFNTELIFNDNFRGHITYRDLAKRYNVKEEHIPLIKEYYKKDYELITKVDN